jgi:predicted O-methyltransferase YrrM
MQNNYKFDHDWFSGNIGALLHLKQNWRYLSSKPIEILEIGSFEGRSTVFFAEVFLNANITCIDTWQGGVDHDPDNPEIDFTKVKANFDHNTAFFKDRVTINQGYSIDELCRYIGYGKKFDFIYVDGSHTARDVLQDLVLSFKLLNVNGVIYCDDYLWGYNDSLFNGDRNVNPFNTPKLAIDAFSTIYRDVVCMPTLPYSGAAAFIKVGE